MNNKLMFSNESNEWTTRQETFQPYDDEFNFTLDAAATAENAKCKRFFTEQDNALIQDWSNEVVWLNPPYGRELGKWIQKVYEEWQKGATVVCLIPARTDTKYWHKYIWDSDNHIPLTGIEVRFLKGRLIFGSDEYWKWLWDQEFIKSKPNPLYKKYGKMNSAPFPSAIVVFR